MTRTTTDVAVALEALDAGRLVGLPTETVYGLAADATQVDAVRSVFTAKGRPPGHPLIVHLADADQIDDWAREVPDAARRLAARWWPGPVTILLRRSDRVLDEVTGGRDTVALRVPDHPLALALLRRLAADGRALVAPSANRFGRVSPTTAADVVAELGDAVAVVLDGGPCTVGIESAIVDLSGPTPRLLRAGRVPIDVLREDVPDLEVAADAAPAVAPGMLASHYAPAARVVLVESPGSDDVRPEAADVDVLAAIEAERSAGRRVGLLAADPPPDVPADVVVLDTGGSADGGTADDVAAYARVLYARLRAADAAGLDVLVVVPPPARGAGIAVRDRLRRAAHPRPDGG